MFQSTHPHGVRPGIGCGVGKGVKVSIHAPTWGATSPTAPTSVTTSGFNPRTHMGCDMMPFCDGE